MLIKANTGLLVVDIQGKLSHLVHDSESMFRNVIKLIKGCSLLDLPIIALEQNPEKLGSTASEIEALLGTYPHIKKFNFNACNEQTFIEQLNKTNIDTWLVCGIESHICVYQTAMGLKMMDKSVSVVTDCISSRHMNNKMVAIDKFKANNIGLTSVEMCLFELIKDCRDAKFKELLNIIR